MIEIVVGTKVYDPPITAGRRVPNDVWNNVLIPATNSRVWITFAFSSYHTKIEYFIRFMNHTTTFKTTCFFNFFPTLTRFEKERSTNRDQNPARPNGLKCKSRLSKSSYLLGYIFCNKAQNTGPVARSNEAKQKMFKKCKKIRPNPANWARPPKWSDSFWTSILSPIRSKINGSSD